MQKLIRAVIFVVVVIALVLVARWLTGPTIDEKPAHKYKMGLYASAVNRGASAMTCPSPPRGYDRAKRHGLTDVCFACPTGYVRTANPDVNARNACAKDILGITDPKPAWTANVLGCSGKRNEAIDGIKYAQAFLDVGRNQCYSCPIGYARTGDSIDAATACALGAILPIDCKAQDKRLGGYTVQKVVEPADDAWGAPFRHQLTNDCYSCPEGYDRTVSSINAANACEKVISSSRWPF